jgi:hypothetical protein
MKKNVESCEIKRRPVIKPFRSRIEPEKQLLESIQSTSVLKPSKPVLKLSRPKPKPVEDTEESEPEIKKSIKPVVHTSGDAWGESVLKISGDSWGEWNSDASDNKNALVSKTPKKSEEPYRRSFGQSRRKTGFITGSKKTHKVQQQLDAMKTNKFIVGFESDNGSGFKKIAF